LPTLDLCAEGDRMDPTEAQDPRVLVIDDDEDLRELVGRVVKQAGYAVDAVADGQAGLEQLGQRPYDVILCDLRMPRMDGRAFYQEVQRAHPDLARRIVLMTAHVKVGEYADFVRAVRAPTLQKPFSLEEFRATLARMVGPRAPRPPAAG
jgi:CheY-like chemotaxis protein